MVGFGLFTGGQSEPKNGPKRPHFSENARGVGVVFSTGEALLVLVMQIVGLFSWTFIFSSLIVALTRSDPAQKAFDKNLDKINAFISYFNIDPMVGREMRYYLHATKKMQYHEIKASLRSDLTRSPGEDLDEAQW